MKVRKKEENCDWQESGFQSKSPKSILSASIRDSRGFNLIEVMVSTAITGIVALGISSIYMFVIDNFKVMVNQNAAQESLLWIAYQTKALLQQSTEAACANVTCNFSSSTTPIGGFTTLAQFQREASDGGSSFLVPTRIKYRQFQRELDITNPAASVPFQNYNAMGGAVVFTLDSTGIPNNNNEYIGNLWYDRVVRYDIVGTGASRNVSIATRYFASYDNPVLNFCHPNNIGCATLTNNRSYRDITMDVMVALRNTNVMGTGSGVHGNLYYYRYVAPPLLIGF